MADEYAKLWVQSNLNRVAEARALEAIEATGRALPCTVTAVDGSFVTVTFNVSGPYTLPALTLPKAESAWMRSPTQVGDVGLTIPADVTLAGINGQGGGVPQLGVNYGNLTSLVWVPVASTAFASAPSANKAWANGPGGARIGSSGGGVSVDCDETSGVVTITAGGKTWTFSSAGLTMSSGVVLETHVHSGVTSGASDTGPPA